jgi:predicted ribosomally synthesized peptide with SipW-like signal peptide
MINKKMILGVLAIGMLAVVAGATTWAYYQDTLTTTNNQITTAGFKAQYSTSNPMGQGVSSADYAVWNDFGTNGLATVPGGSVTAAVLDGNFWLPFTTDGHIAIKNADTSPLDVYVEAVPTVDSTTILMNALSIRSDSVNIVTNGVASTTPVFVATLPAGTVKNCALTYQFVSDPNSIQNSQAGQTYKFNVKVFVVPSGTQISSIHTT